MNWDTSCVDWQDRLLSGRSLVPDLPLFENEAERALRIFKRLPVPDIIGKPKMGDVAGPWLYPIVEAIFGSYDPETNRRMIQEFFWLIPKKNGKTSSAAAIMVEALILNRRPEGEFVLVAPTKEVADISYRQASGTIRADPELEKLFQLQSHIRKITHRRTGAALQVKAADTDVITGSKAVGTLIDELHVLGAKSNADEIMVELRGALAARPDGFLITITTQSKRPPVGVFKKELNYARAVRDGEVKAPLLPVLYELPESEQENWRERRLWNRVNPNLGRSVDEAFLDRELEKAEKDGPVALALFASQHFNVEVGIGLKSDHWPGARHWAKNADKELGFAEILQRCDLIMVGGDGGGLDDLLGMAVIGREHGTGDWLHWAHAWVHEDVLDLRKEIASALRDFTEDGDLEIVPAIGDAFDGFADLIEQIFDAGILGQVGLDPAGVKEIVDRLASRGITQDGGHVIGVRQGYTLCGTIKGVEGRLSDGRLRHCGQRLMDWCVGNAMVKVTGSNVMITKQASGIAKIDPLMATFDAADRMFALADSNFGPSVYEERELTILRVG